MEKPNISEFAQGKFELAISKSMELAKKSSLSKQDELELARYLLKELSSKSPQEIEEMAKNEEIEKFVLDITKEKLSN